MPRKVIVVGVVWGLPSGVCGCDVVIVVVNVILVVVLVAICCCCDVVVHGELLVVLKWEVLFSLHCSVLKMGITLSILRIK